MIYKKVLTFWLLSKIDFKAVTFYRKNVLAAENSAKKFLGSNDPSHNCGSVAGPVIQGNGRLSFENDLRSGGL